MRLLNLFSGTGSVSKPWRAAGHEVWDVDVDPRFSPKTCGDILQWDYKNLDFIPDVIWSSPPCDQYSRARTRAKTPRNLALADRLVAKALEIIYFFLKRIQISFGSWRMAILQCSGKGRWPDLWFWDALWCWTIVATVSFTGKEQGLLTLLI